VSDLDPKVARASLDARNELCGDTWCEGSFEWFAYDLRSDRTRSELTLRAYTTVAEPVADVSTIVVTGVGYTGRVLGQHLVPSCSGPCGLPDQMTWSPCELLDVRCEITRPHTEDLDWEKPLIECGIALQHAIRERIPESYTEDDAE